MNATPDPVVQGIDRMVRNIETGRFERSLSALTAAGPVVMSAEIYFEHDSASFGSKMMWIRVAVYQYVMTSSTALASRVALPDVRP